MTQQHPPAQPAAFVKLAVFENELEARQLESELLSRSIPHLVKSYRDPAYVGIVQNHRGWGHLEAPAMFREEIEQIRRDLGESADPLPPGTPKPGFVRWATWLFLGWLAVLGMMAWSADEGLLVNWVSTVLILVLAAWFIRRPAGRILERLRTRTRESS